jgi:hypothetical protein
VSLFVGETCLFYILSYHYEFCEEPKMVKHERWEILTSWLPRPDYFLDVNHMCCKKTSLLRDCLDSRYFLLALKTPLESFDDSQYLSAL